MGGLKYMILNRYISLAAALGLTVVTVATGWADEVDDLVRAEMKRQQIPGCAIAVVRDGQVVKAAAYGVANAESGAPVTTDTLFRIQSVSKQFTAAGVMLLVEEGKLGLDDPVGRHLEGIPPAWAKLTIRHLLTQTSGLPDFVNESLVDLRADHTEEQLLAAIAGRPLKFVPGEAWAYSNSNYHLLAMIIRRVTGRWYGDFLAERIFQPIGMTRTTVLQTGETDHDVAVGHTLERGRLKGASTVALSVASYGGGGIRSTILDLAKWDAVLYTDRLLKQASRERMWTPAVLNNGTAHGYGFGWEIGEIAGHRRLAHSGKWLGFSAQIDRFVGDHLTVILLANQSETNPARITRAVAGHYLPGVAVRVYAPIPDTEPEVTARFRDVLRRSASGGLQAEDFTAEAWPYMEPLLGQLRRDMAVFGELERLTLLERTEQDGVRHYRYRTRFKRTTLRYHFALAPDGRIAVMTPEGVNE